MEDPLSLFSEELVECLPKLAKDGVPHQLLTTQGPAPRRLSALPVLEQVAPPQIRVGRAYLHTPGGRVREPVDVAGRRGLSLRA